MIDLRARRPEEGWLALALVVVMIAVLGTAVDDPGYVNGRGNLTDCLVWFGLLGVAVGFVGPKVGWGRWTTHGVGALFAGLLIPIAAGWAILPGSSVSGAFMAAADGSINAYLDVAWRGLSYTVREVHYVIVLGAIVWAAGQFTAYAVFGHRRPLNAVIMAGIVLLANMSMTFDQLPYLVVFTGASLFLLIEMHAFDERATWIRRRIGDPATISSLYLRGGTVFILAAMLGSLLLMQRATSSPLAGAWGPVRQQLVDVGETIGRLLPVGGNVRGGGVTFGPLAKIGAQWFGTDDPAFTAVVPPNEKELLYWRAATYDSFALGAWVQTNAAGQPVAAGQPLLTDTAEDPDPKLTHTVKVTVRPTGFLGSDLLTPGTPTSVDVDSSVRLVGQDGWYGGVDVAGSPGEYTIEAQVLDLTNQDRISGHRLEAASTVYPKELTDLYTQIPEGAIGPDATDLLNTIKELAKTENPYDLAKFMETYLRGKQFVYSIDLRDQPCDSPSAVECFARTKHGYCLHYASTMAILLRAANPDNPIPTRVVEGFLPADPVGGVVNVTNRGAHAWVEVYFPGYGWIPFDPTGGNIGRPSQIRPGPSISPGPVSSARDFPDPTRPLQAGDGNVVTPPPGSGGSSPIANRALLIVLTVLLFAVVASIAFAAWLRGPRGEITPDRAWQSMAKAAGRFGFGPRPNQTVYEYASSLGELVPVAKTDLSTIAEAKVETSYARVRLGGDRLNEVGHATRRVRVSLLRLLFRRRGRGKRRR